MERRIQALQIQLNEPPTDWDSIYIRIKLSPLGADFTPEKFLTTPVGTLKWLLAKLLEHEQIQQNITAYPTAVLNTQVMWAMYGMGGGKGSKPQATYQDFLPFPKVQSADQPELSAANLEATRAALRRALGAGQIPYDIFITLWRGPTA